MNRQDVQLSTGAEGEWPTLEVVKQALADPRWRPQPFNYFVVKLHGRCNLSCDYCYMYELADQSWRGKPVAMTRRTIDRTAERIAEHIQGHDLNGVHVILHGGEPLLAGPSMIEHAAAAFQEGPAGVLLRRSSSRQTACYSTMTCCPFCASMGSRSA
ncbi:radical SAM protein [Micromonospora sp. M12]